jgi:hypothetical protein
MKTSAYHGTNKFFKNFDFSKIGDNTADLNNVNLGACFTDNYDYAMDYAEYAGGNTVLKAHISVNNPYEISNSQLEDICTDAETAQAFKDQIIADGYDSIINYTSIGCKEFICFYPEQIHILNKGKNNE